VHPRDGVLTQVMDGDALDAAVLVAPMVGLPIGDDVLARTLDAVAARLGDGPLVWRYRNDDGLPGEEGSFLVCAFWLVDALLALDRAEEARARFEALLARGNDLGLFPEEMAADGTFLGNFPQAFTHLGLVQSALLLELHEAGGAAALRGTHADRSRRLASLRGEA
jgi:GH15 family glucan-1,4-alpha-glucosidase